VHIAPRDDETVAQVIGPLVHRAEPRPIAPEVIVMTADAESSVAVARVLGAAQPGRVVPLSSERRGARLLSAHPVAGIASAPDVVLALVRRSALKLDRVQTVVLAWVEDILAAGEGDALASVMAEIPRDAARVLVAATLTPAVEEIAERYLRRAPRLGISHIPADAGPIALSYVPVTPAARRRALRQVLDEIDPPSAAVYARTERGAADAREALRELGYRDDDPQMTVVSGPGDPAAAVVVLYDLPATAEQLRSVAGTGSRRLVALADPRDLDRLRSLAAGPIAPLTVREPVDRARRRDELAREDLRAELRRGTADRHLLALEPLLDEFDAIEIAAAALRLRDRALERAAAAAPVTDSPAPSRSAWTRLFLTVGTRDNVRAGDLVGMITGEGGITSDKIGKIELRESHSLVEIAADAAEQVVKRINGAQVKGRRIVARPERDGRGGRKGGAELSRGR
jgi:ATP-dependent RNA helicase DeaD